MYKISLIMKLKNEVTTEVEEVNQETGEITTKVITTSKVYSSRVQAEEFYITFISTLSKIIGLNRMTDVRVLALLCSKAEFNTGIVQLTPYVKELIYTELKISYNSLANSLSFLKKKDFITLERGKCTINPLLFWKGDLKARQELLRTSGLEFIINFRGDGDD